MWPKEKDQSRLKNLSPPDFTSVDKAARSARESPLPIYTNTQITTTS